MTTAALITKLKKQLDKETDKSILKSIEILLRDDTKEARIKQRMLEGAIRSEEDIAQGKIMSGAEAKRKLKAHMAARRRSREQEKRAKRA